MRVVIGEARTPEFIAQEALLAARSAGLSSMRLWVAEAAKPFTDGVSEEEQKSWPAKEAAATAVLAGNATPGQQSMIAAEAMMTGEQISSLCETILAKAALYNPAVGIIAGLRRAVESGLAAATDPAACAAVVTTEIAKAQGALEGAAP